MKSLVCLVTSPPIVMCGGSAAENILDRAADIFQFSGNNPSVSSIDSVPALSSLRKEFCFWEEPIEELFVHKFSKLKEYVTLLI